MTNDEKREVESKVDKVCAELAEHFDTVHIFVTLHEGGAGNTASLDRARGSFYTRFGQLREWVIRQEEYIREEARISQRKELE